MYSTAGMSTQSVKRGASPLYGCSVEAVGQLGDFPLYGYCVKSDSQLGDSRLYGWETIYCTAGVVGDIPLYGDSFEAVS